MNFLRNLDLYRGIVLLSLVLLPIGGWMVTNVDKEIAACKLAITNASKAGGLIEEIGKLQRKVEVVVQNKRSMSDSIKDPSTYFQGQLLLSGPGLKANDFSLQGPKEELSALPSKQRIADYVIDIVWPRKDMAVKMDFVHAALFNCESGASNASEAAQQSVWRLRDLKLVNLTDANAFSGAKTPPPELDDKWRIEEMKFARREPRKSAN